MATHKTKADTASAVDALLFSLNHTAAAEINLLRAHESIDDPGRLLKWLAKDRATVRFSGMDDLAARKDAFQTVLRQWIRFV